MKPFKTSWGFLLSVPALFLITSCSKNMDEQQSKSANDVEQLAVISTPVCTNTIGMQMRDNAGGSYFWIGPVRTDVSKQTSFSGMDFSDNQLITVSALGPVGAVPNHSVSGEHLGVKSSLDFNPTADPTRINVGETLIMKLGTKMGSYLIREVKLQLLSNTANPGMVEFWLGGNKVAEKAMMGLTPHFNSGFEYTAPLNGHFDAVRIVCTSGNVRVNARNSNPPPTFLPPTQFVVIQNAGAALNTNTVPNRPLILAFSGAYNNYVGAPQTNNGVASNMGGFGFNASPEYLKITTNAAEGLVWSSSGARLSALSASPATTQDIRSISTTETITVEPGSSFGSMYFGGAEIRVAHEILPSNNPLMINFYDGQTLVESVMTNGVDAAYNLYYPSKAFDKMTITGTGEGATIGRPGYVLRMYRGCK